MGLIRDLAAVKVETTGGGNSFMPELYLQDGEKAFVKFLSAFDGVSDDRSGVALVHSVKKVSKKGKDYSVDRYCTLDDDGQCELCDAVEDNKNISKASKRILIWMMVDKILHRNQNKNVGQDNIVWRKVADSSGNTYFEEDVQGPMLLRKGIGKGGYMIAFFNEFRNTFGALDTKTYQISRSGHDFTSTSYNIMPLADAVLTKEEVKVAKSLPDVDLVFKNQVNYNKETGEFSVIGEEGTVTQETVSEVVVEDVEEAVPLVIVGAVADVQHETALSRLQAIAKASKVSAPDENGLVELS